MYQNPYFLQGLGGYQKPRTDPQSLGVNINKPVIPNMNPSSQYPQSAGGGGFNYGKVIGDISSGITSGAASAANQGQFEIDPNAGLKGSASGLAQGGWIGAIVGGLTAQYKNFSEVNKNLNKLDTNVNLTGTDAYGNPTYQGQNFTGSTQTMKELEQGKKKIEKSIDPATWLFSRAMGTKKKLKKKKQEISKNLTFGQTQYNKAAQESTQRQNAMEDFYDSQNSTNRMNNLYATR